MSSSRPTPRSGSGRTTSRTGSRTAGTATGRSTDVATDAATGRTAGEAAGASTGLWLCLHLPRLGLELFTRSLADGAASRPVVLVAAHRVVQVNAAGRARGLHDDMSLATAESICADLAIAWREEAREAATLERLAHWAYRFTPRISCIAPADLLLEVSGSLRLFRGLDRLQQRILDGIRALGYSALPGLAPTPLAAQALARSGRSPDPQQLATTLAFDGRGDSALRAAWCKAIADAARPALAGMPLVFLDRPRSELDRLQAMGLGTVGELLRLPGGPLGRRLGAPLLDHLDRLTGRRPDPRESLQPPDTFGSTVHFLEDLEHLDALAFPMQRLLGELADWLRLRQLATDRLDWHLIHPAHGDRRMRVRFAVPQRDRTRMLDYSRMQLEREGGPAAVATLTLRVTRVLDPGARSPELFPGLSANGEDDDQGGEDPANLVDLLHARLGAEVCRSVLPADDHRPEHAWRAVAPVPARGAASAARGAAAVRANSAGIASGPRPLWLLEQPRRLTTHDDRPCWHGPLTLCRGPERIDTGWWAQACWKVSEAGPDGLPAPPAPRDYWVARHRDGAHLWVFRELTEGCWYLHGFFS